MANYHPPQSPQKPPIERTAFSREEAAESLGVSTRTLDKWLADPGTGFPSARLQGGGKVLIPVAALKKWVDDLTEPADLADEG